MNTARAFFVIDEFPEALKTRYTSETTNERSIYDDCIEKNDECTTIYEKCTAISLSSLFESNGIGRLFTTRLQRIIPLICLSMAM